MGAMDALQQKTARFEIKEASDKGEFSGYASVFDLEDADGEAIAPGAFAASLAEHEASGTNPALLWQHQVQEPIGKWLELEEDEKGLRAKGKLFIDAIQRAKEAFVLLKEKAVTGLSIGFIPKKWEFDEDTWMVTFTEVNLLEVSIVTLPANSQARVGEVKRRAQRAQFWFQRAREEIKDPRAFERFCREAGFSRRQAEVLTYHAFSAQGEPGAVPFEGQGEPGSGHQGEPDLVQALDTELRRINHDFRSTLGGKAAG